jgi:limonene-1,2-epoxide hydrolase
MSAEFVERFEAAWATSDAGELMHLLHPEVRLRQPLLPPINGRDEAAVVLGRFLEATPGIHVDIRGWAPTSRGVLIEFDAVVPGPWELRWGIVDRFDLDGDLATFRISYWDMPQLRRGLLARPDVLLRSWRRGARPRGARVGASPPPLRGVRGSVEIAEFTRDRVRACVSGTRVYVATPLPWRRVSPPTRQEG